MRDSDASWAGPGGFNPVFSNVTIGSVNVSNVPIALDMDGLDTDTNMSITFSSDTFTNVANSVENITDGTATYPNSTVNGSAMQ